MNSTIGLSIFIGFGPNSKLAVGLSFIWTLVVILLKHVVIGSV